MDFCSVSNISEALEQLSEEVAVLGFNPIPQYKIKTDNDSSVIVVSLSNIVWSLLKSRQKQVDKVRESNEQQCILNSEIKCLKTKIKRLEDELVQNEKLLNSTLKEGLQMKNRQTLADTDMKKIKQELLRAQGLIKSRTEQTTLKLRELHEENAELKRKLMKKLLHNEKSGDNKTVLPINTTLKQSINPTTSNDLGPSLPSKKEELLRKSILKLQNNIQTLVSENIQLKKSNDKIYCAVAQNNNEHV